MDPFFVKAAQLLLSLSILIVLHELGHFIPAKLFKTRVEKFYLFFDVKFSLFKKKIGETVYGIGWLPLGGYVKISGMIDESMDKEQMAQPPQPWEFRSKPAWQRLIIMLGGVTVNIILGFFIYMMVLFTWGENYVDKEGMKYGFAPSSVMQELGFEEGDVVTKVNGKGLFNVLDIQKFLLVRNVKSISVERDGRELTFDIPDDISSRLFQADEYLTSFEPIYYTIIDSVLPGQPAELAGLQKGDWIVSVNDETTKFWHEFKSALTNNPNEQVKIGYIRDGSVNVNDSTFSIEDFGNRITYATITPTEDNKIGFSNYQVFEVKNRTFSFVESLSAGFDYGYWTLHDYVAQFKFIFTKKGASQVGGFGAIGNMFPSAWNWQAFWMNTAFISIALAFMNILPIPALDGGHVVFLLYEMVSGRKPNEKVLEYAQMVGFFLLIGLLLFANGNDIYRWLFQ